MPTLTIQDSQERLFTSEEATPAVRKCCKHEIVRTKVAIECYLFQANFRRIGDLELLPPSITKYGCTDPEALSVAVANTSDRNYGWRLLELDEEVFINDKYFAYGSWRAITRLSSGTCVSLNTYPVARKLQPQTQE